jgi:hypothetical protein
MVWRQDADLVYILYQDNHSYTLYEVRDAPTEYENDHELLKGAFGWLWHTQDAIRNHLGEPLVAEANPTDFVIQDFSGGVIFYFVENNANSYVLFQDQNSWLMAPE